jgi:iron complex outermembrane receptor protein
LVQAKSVGYASISDAVDLNSTHELNFKLTTSAIEANEVVVTGSAFTTDNKRSSMSVVPIDKKQLLLAASNNITDAIAQTPGVAGISTGSAISKPVIRGLGYNRIVTINEGLRQEGQQWGDEHGLEIDQFSADRIEVLKGPSSLLYGSDALGGVINILEPIPPPLGVIKGEVVSQFSTNNLLVANSAMLEGNNAGFVWRGRVSYKNAASYFTPTERIYNSAYSEFNGNALFGVNKKWGYSHFHFSNFSTKVGLIEGERDSATGKFLNADGEVVSNNEALKRTIDLPFQRINHVKLSSVSSIFIKNGNLKITAGWQQNNRKEFSFSDVNPGLAFQLNTYSLDTKYYFPEKHGFESVVGLTMLAQQNKNLGVEYLIPDYKQQDVGGFFSLKKNLEKITLNAGVRFDTRLIQGESLMQNTLELFKSFNEQFSAITGSIGTTWQISKQVNLKANVGRGFRAPNISELSANGVHEGTFRYEIGDTNLKPETSLQFDLGLGVETKHMSIALSTFYNLIDNFIYYRNTANEIINAENNIYPVYRYVQGNSSLKGFEFNFDVHPVDPLHFENSVSYVYATNESNGYPLPFIPPFHYKSTLSYTFHKSAIKKISDPYFKLIMDVFADQNRYDQFETATKGATIFGVSTGANFQIGKQVASFYIVCANLTNQSYFEHLSRLKSVGIHAMGTNVTIGLSIPFGIR